VEHYKKYLDLFSDFVSTGIRYRQMQALDSITGNDSDKKNIIKEYRKKAAALYVEFKKLPENLQVPEVEEKLINALNLK
jgi:hypothetical protein